MRTTRPGPTCFFHRHAVGDRTQPEVSHCDGRLVRCHLIPQGVLKRTDAYKQLIVELDQRRFLYDPRSWVWGCGGPMGLSGHHGQFDTSKRIRVPRASIPAGTEQLAAELELTWFLDQTYGVRECTVR